MEAMASINPNSLPAVLSGFTLTTYCLVGLGSLALWYVVSAVRAWHRLQHFPAPSLLASFSYLWLARTTYSGTQYWVHRELHRKHGPLVRVGRHKNTRPMGTHGYPKIWVGLFSNLWVWVSGFWVVWV
ncbi:hypothetical protein CTA1_4575 [Colletotrichum tanaceti]|uniref:Uncharacterized protein n=1 Tax=Colletotrichum tanaceti TaxID=1306861 RepID=A0A4U6WYI7_9PEZI|nr:hypothetical protein CTA1_4575 [Colletotrichum tanaceti]